MEIKINKSAETLSVLPTGSASGDPEQDLRRDPVGKEEKQKPVKKGRAPKAPTDSPIEKANTIALEMFGAGHIVVDETLYRYEEEEGYWKRTERAEGNAIIGLFFRKTYGAAGESSKREIISLISDLTWQAYAPELRVINQNTEWINLKSFQYNIFTGAKKPYERASLAFHKLDFDLVKDPDPKLFVKFCAEVFWDKAFADDFEQTLEFVMEWIGYCLVPGNPFQQALLMVGGGQNGKGTLMEVIKGVVGASNTSSIDIEEINRKNGLWMAKNKLVNFCGDAESGEQLDTSVMKRVVAGETVLAKELYKNYFEMPFTAKLVMAANDIPFSKNVGFAVQRRFIMLPMRRRFELVERDIDLKAKLLAEYPDILTLALKKLPILFQRKHFVIPRRCTMLYDEYALQNDSVRQWMEDEEREGDPDKDRCLKSDAKRDYLLYCRESNLKPLGPQKLYARLSAMGLSMKKDTNGTRYFYGIKKPVNAPSTY